jgi:hypothetical protein
MANLPNTTSGQHPHIISLQNPTDHSRSNSHMLFHTKIQYSTSSHNPTFHFGPNCHIPHHANLAQAISGKHPKYHVPSLATFQHITASQHPTTHFGSKSHCPRHAKITQHIQPNIRNTNVFATSIAPTRHVFVGLSGTTL